MVLVRKWCFRRELFCMKKKEHPNRQEYDIKNEKLPFTAVLTGKIQQVLPVPRKPLVLSQFPNWRTEAGLCMMRLHGSLSESVHINMPLVIIVLIWLFSTAFLKLTIRSYPELKFVCSEFSAGPRNTVKQLTYISSKNWKSDWNQWLPNKYNYTILYNQVRRQTRELLWK